MSNPYLELAINIARTCADDHRLDADHLDRVREFLGRGDVDAWNALVNAADLLRREANKKEKWVKEQSS